MPKLSFYCNRIALAEAPLPAVIESIDELLNLPPAGDPATMRDRTEAFDNDRLSGMVAPLPASYAILPATRVHTMPHPLSTTPGGKRYLLYIRTVTILQP
jgi:hypothetical protein